MSRIQSWFDKMVRGLGKQGWEPALAPDGKSCVYRSKDGKKCAIGHLIDDDSAKATENLTVRGLSYKNRLSSLGLGDINSLEYSFLTDAQDMHDESPVIAITKAPERMKRNFGELAKKFNLNWPIG